MKENRILSFVLFLIFLCFGLYINGAMPGLMTPTTAQAFWLTGFAQSIANQDFSTLHSVNFGYPLQPAISFGLTGAIPTALLIKAGLSAADAYSACIALWLSLAFYSAYRIARLSKLSHILSSACALLWICMPTVWIHSIYSMLSIGIALLPFYAICVMHLSKGNDSKTALTNLVLFQTAAIISIFTDGYTFVMFAVGSLVHLALRCLHQEHRRNSLTQLLIALVSFGVAYYVFSKYIGKGSFERNDLDFFRGWGADLSFFLTPTKGLFWIPDLLSLSTPRNERQWFGDASVWLTTFSIHLIIAAAILLKTSKKTRRSLYSVMAIAAISLYMSLGPSFKIYSQKPVDHDPGPLMAENYAIFATGTSFLSTHVPGLNNMRASYRWSALFIFCLWLLIVISSRDSKYKWASPIIITILLALNLPNPISKGNSNIKNRETFLKINREVLYPVAQYTKLGERVLFLPWDNDFLSNYLSATVNIRSYNIGGDKNLSEAYDSWPYEVKAFNRGQLDSSYPEKIAQLFAKKLVDVVILTRVNLLEAAHYWPAPHKYELDHNAIRAELERKGIFTIQETPNFYFIRPAREQGISSKDICLPPNCLSLRFFNGNSNTQVGSLKNNRMQTTSRSGFLLFGPYVPMREGVYTFTLRGEVANSDSAWVDITSGKGTNTHYKSNLKTGYDNEIIIEDQIIITAPVDHLEVRVFVNAQSRVTIYGYSLTPSDNLNDVVRVVK